MVSHAFDGEGYPVIETAKDLEDNGIRIGVASELNIQKEISERFPNAEISYYIPVNGFEALKSGKIDAYINGKDQFQAAIYGGLSGVKILEDEYLLTREVAFGMSRYSTYPDFEKRVNEFVDDMRQQGVIEEVYDRWIVKKERTIPSDIPKPLNPEHTIVIGTNGELVPYTYYEGSELTGAEIEIAYRLAAYLNADVRFVTASWDGLITGLSSGKFDIVASNLYIDESRKKTIDYSKPYFDVNMAYLVRDNDQAKVGFFQGLMDRLHHTLIENDRWLTLLEGLRTTLVITFGSFLLANIIGAVFCAMAMSLSRLLKGIAAISTCIMQGTPIVVLLMIIYYIIFARSDISGTVVSIICFGMSTGASLALNFKSALIGVEKGQWEAAYSLGFTRLQTFFGVVAPQAAVGLIPLYFNELIYLMKGTAVVGYVAVMDLTKMGDIIRSATFDAFVSLFVVALIYLLMAWIMIKAADLLLKRVDPMLRKRIVKGVKVK